MTNVWSTTVADWQGVADKSIAGSDDIIKSGAVAGSILQLQLQLLGDAPARLKTSRLHTAGFRIHLNPVL